MKKRGTRNETEREREDRYVRDYRMRDLAAMCIGLERSNTRLRGELARAKVELRRLRAKSTRLEDGS